MRKHIKINALIFVIIFVVGLIFPIGLIKTKKMDLITNTASASGSVEFGYYYNQLSTDQKRFYAAIYQMESSDMLARGDKYDLISNKKIKNIEIEEFTAGSNKIIEDFEKAKDAFNLDHPEVFYVDFDKLSLSIGLKNNKFICTIDAGRYENYFATGFENKDDVSLAISNYNREDNWIGSLVKNINSNSIQTIVSNLNNIIKSKTYYGYGNGENSNFISTTYGLIEYGVTDSEGYAKTFKACMDLLEENCIVVKGYLIDDNFQIAKHYWNYVECDGRWYAVDTCLNDKNGAMSNKYLLVGKDTIKATHIEDESEFSYPEIHKLDYETKKVDVNIENGICKVSYENQNASALYSSFTPLYLCVTYADYKNGEYVWAYENDSKIIVAEALHFIIDEAEGIYTEDTIAFNQHDAVKYFVTNQVPDVESKAYSKTEFSLNGIIAWSDIIYKKSIFDSFYSPEISISNIYKTKNYPVNNVFESGESYLISLKFDSAITFEEGKNINDVVIKVFNENENMLEYVEIYNIMLKSESEIEFIFKSSELYKFSDITYRFAVINCFNSSHQKIAPFELKFSLSNLNITSLKNNEKIDILADENIYIVDNNNIEINGWTYSDYILNGTRNTRSNQIKSLTLISKGLTDVDEKTALDKVKAEMDDEIIASYVKNLSLSLYGDQINSNGQVFDICFAYPKGYNLKSEDVEFLVYYINEEDVVLLDSVITGKGIVVNADNFGTFAVVVKTMTENYSKYIYARNLNFGGDFELTSNDTSTVVKLLENESVNYSINLQDKYKLDYVLINGTKIETDDGFFEIKYENLQKFNTIDIAYISEETYQYEQENGIINLNLNHKLKNRIIIAESVENRITNIVIIVMSIIMTVVVASALTIVFVINKKCKNLKNNNKNNKKINKIKENFENNNKLTKDINKTKTKSKISNTKNKKINKKITDKNRSII